MNHENGRKGELYSLFSGLCDGTLNATEHSRLQAILKADASAREEYLEYIELHLDLKRLTTPAGDLPPNSDRMVQAILESPPWRQTSEPQTQTSSFKYRQSRHGAWLWSGLSATVAATIVLTLGQIWLARNISNGPDLLADNSKSTIVSKVRLTQISSTRFFGEANPDLQSIVPFGRDYVLSEGIIELSFPNGATTIIESPAIFEVVDDNKLMMKTGICSVHAPEGAQGFRVDTPMANVVDLGTRFVLNVNQSGETKVYVVEGEADVFTKPTATNLESSSVAPIKLREREARFIELDDRAAKVIPFEASEYRATLPDRLIDFEAVENSSGAVDELIAVSLQRNATECNYSVEQLIGIDLVHFRGTSNAFMVTSSNISDPPSAQPDGLSRARFLDRDRSLCSGLINPGGQSTPLEHDPILDKTNSAEVNAQGTTSPIGTPGIGVRFRAPVTNSAGPDVLVFELQTIVNSEKGDAFHVSPLQFEPGLRSFTVRHYDIDLTSPQSRYLAPFNLYRSVEFSNSLDDALQTVHRGGVLHHIPAKVIAVGIDLTDLGYAANAQCDGLFFQDAADDIDYFDPVFIAGLPAIQQ